MDILWRRVAAPPRLPRGYFAEKSRGDAATWIFSPDRRASQVPGVVARADLWKVGQARPGDLFELEATTADAAAAALRELRAATLDVERLVTEDVDLATMALAPNQMGEWEGRE